MDWDRELSVPGFEDVVILPPKRLTPEPNGRSGICSCGERFRISFFGYASRKWVEHPHNPVWADDGSCFYVVDPDAPVRKYKATA